MGKLVVISLTILTMAFFYSPAVSASEIDWGKVKGQTTKVFYPGVSSWEFMKGKDHGKGGPVVEKGEKACAACHVSKEGKYDINADNIISGKLMKVASKTPLEPNPMPDMKGFKDVEVKAAYDAENIYLRFQWEGSGASVKDASLAKDGKADRIAVQINDVMRVFKNYGCYITCHDDQKNMPGDTKKDIKLYGFYTRDEKSGIKPQAKLDEYLSKRQFIDLWVASFEGSKVVGMDEHILQDRLEDKNDISATGGYEGGRYTVVFKRKLSTGDNRDITIKDGSAFNIGIAVHDNKHGDRRHYTSFPVSIGLGTSADITAEKF